MNNALIYIIIAVILILSELLYFNLADKFNIIDKPNERSSHTKVTLRGGGIIFFVGGIIFFLINGFQYPWFFLGLSLISIISFADDIRPKSFKIRLLVHFISMFFLFYQWNLFTFHWYYTLIALVICTGIINVYNFMDGINGITGGYSLVVSLCLLYINNYRINFIENQLTCIVIISLLIFNFFNFRNKAKCFAGDIGAISIAFIFIFLLGKLIIATGDFSYLILIVVYGTDSILTIIHRLILKENIFIAHRRHAFQIMANEMKIPHLAVSAFYALLQGIIVVVYLSIKSGYAYLILVTILLSVLYGLFKYKFSTVKSFND